jgi:methylmalonyl-CoA mutase N-terminal domain/subunit
MTTQQILAFESRIANVADPLAGSYFVEALTDKMETEITRILAEIQEIGGMAAAQEIGWADDVIKREALKIQKQTESGERVIVGVNRFVSKSNHDKNDAHEVSPELVRQQIDRLIEFKRNRDGSRVGPALLKLRDDATRRNVNLFPAAMEAIEHGATLGEINGYIRMGFGYPYDDFATVQPPF